MITPPAYNSDQLAGEPVDLRYWINAIRHPHGPKSPTTRHVLLTLATWGSADGTKMFPSIEVLAIATGLHEETVRRWLVSAAKQGWVIRWPERKRGAAIFSYKYRACVPRGWKSQHPNPRAWEKDPNYRFQTATSRRVRVARDPAQSRVAPTATDTVLSVVRPRFGQSPTLSTIVDHPVMDRGTSSSINPSINTCTNKAFKKNDAEVILDKVEKAFKQLVDEGRSAQLDDVETIGLIAAATRYTDYEVMNAIDKLIEQKRLPLQLSDNLMNSRAVGDDP
jgi:hypothetical protein